MSTGDPEMRRHLAKAVQFLDASQLALDARLGDAAVSCAVTAGIHATDAICVARLGRRSAGGSHHDAVDLARRAGNEGRRAASHLQRLLAVKNKAQYDASPVTAAAAGRAVETARRLVDLARQVVAG